MAAAPDDDARRTLAELEAKLRELERELLRGYEPGQIEADPFAAPEEPAVEAAAFPPAAAEPEPAAPEPSAFPSAAAEPEPAAPEPSAFPSAAAEPEPAEPEPAAFPPAAAEPEPAAPEPAAFPPAAAETEPPAFDAAEWATPAPREHAQPEAADEPAPTYDGGLGREPLPDYGSVDADEAEPAAPYPAAPQPPVLAPEPEPEPEPEPVARLDHDALDAAHGMLAALRDTIEDMGLTAARVSAEAKAVADDHGRTLGRMARAAQAAARAEEAAHEAGRLAATVVVEAGPFADAGAVTALRDALASQPGALDAYVRGVEGGRAVIEVHLAPPSA
jgi:hypothetical protein